uniref:Uncharacterized protein n=1 Tax=Helianthus annuus TaxID=4232 RepID=A0A251V3P2_HELAN
MLMHGFPIFSFIYLPVFYTTPNPRERWSEREREKCDGEGDVVWTTARTPAAGEHHHRSSLPPYEHHWSSLPLPNTTTGVPCRRLTPPEFPAAARTPPEFRGAARTPSEFLAVHRSTSNVHLVAYTSNSKVGILDIYVFLPLLIWYCTLLASQQPTSSRIFNGIWYLQHYFLLFVNLQALRMHAG